MNELERIQLPWTYFWLKYDGGSQVCSDLSGHLIRSTVRKGFFDEKKQQNFVGC